MTTLNKSGNQMINHLTLLDDSPADDVLAGEPDKCDPSCDIVLMPSGKVCPGRGLIGPPALSGFISRRDSRVMPHSRNLYIR
jgi:hypothetical protein